MIAVRISVELRLYLALAAAPTISAASYAPCASLYSLYVTRVVFTARDRFRVVAAK